MTSPFESVGTLVYSSSFFYAQNLGFVAPLRFYNSRTHGQRIVAKVEAITADGLYDLDVKKAALPSNISRYAMRLQFSWV